MSIDGSRKLKTNFMSLRRTLSSWNGKKLRIIRRNVVLMLITSRINMLKTLNILKAIR